MKKRQEELESHIKELMADNEILLVDGYKVTYKNVKPRVAVNEKRLQAEKPDIYKKYQKTIIQFDKNDFKEHEPELYAEYNQEKQSRRFSVKEVENKQ